MEVGGIVATGVNRANLPNQLRPGERLLIEVVKISAEGEGLVRINGSDVKALLEIPAQIGDKFWAKVGKGSQGGLLLIRESPNQGTISLTPQQNLQLSERGLPLKQETANLVTSFAGSSKEVTIFGAVPEAASKQINFLKLIPEWGSLSGENGAEELIDFLRKMGLDFEQRIWQMPKLNGPQKEAEKEGLQGTIKYQVLQALQNLNDPESKNYFQHLLQEITSQQLWMKTGILDNAFVLFHLPLTNQGRFLSAKVAVESTRKGPKMDESHCRIAIQIETQEFGDFGVDAYFDQDSLFLRLLTKDTSFLSQLLLEVAPETKKLFAKLGFQIQDIEVSKLEKNIEFQNFLKGTRRSGVDLQR